MVERLPHLLFVCSGNLCRSPMAAAIAELVALELGLDAEIRSAGTLGIVDRPAEPRAVAVCREIGIEIGAHRSQGITAELIGWADTIYVMEDIHALKIRELVPDVGEIVVQLGPLAGRPFIDDPLGSWFKGPYRTTRDDLRTAIRRALEGRQRTSSSRP